MKPAEAHLFDDPRRSVQLVRYDAACRALAEAKAVDEVKDLRDKAEALRAYARQARNKALEIDAAEIRIRAERRMGTMLAEQKHNGQMHRGGRPRKTGSKSDPVSERPPTLEDIGVDKHLADRARKLAAVPEAQFESVMAEHREQQAAVTNSAVLKLAQPHVTHNSGSDAWYTPPRYIESARAVMGSIDTDPASSKVPQKWIKAKRYYTAEDDGLTKPWTGRVFMNPSYSQPLIARLSEAFCRKAQAREFDRAIVLTNNATDTEWLQSMMHACGALCFPKGRIKYYDATGKPANTPLQGQVFLYFGNNLRGFLTEFRQYGMVFRNA